MRLTPRLTTAGTSTRSESTGPAPPVPRGLQRGSNSPVLWASRIMNIPRDLQRSSRRAGEFTEISELTCAVLESAFLTFQTLLTPAPGPNQNQPERLRDSTCSPQVGCLLQSNLNGGQRRECPAQSWPDNSSGVRALLQLRAGTCTTTLLEVL